MNKNQIEAVGHFLAYYESDLKYISNFQSFKRGEICSKDFVKKENGSFYKFLIEFKVIRNIPKGISIKVLKETENWIENNKNNKVNAFADHLKNIGLTRNSNRSLVSKIFFLDNPWEIITMDTLTRKALLLKENDYKLYKEKINNYEQENTPEIDELVSYIEPFIKIIHRDFENIRDLDTILKNRLIDKLLWTTGRN